MKKLLYALAFFVIFMGGITYGMDITLSPGWNVVSTPAILSSIGFSNQGAGISFSKLQNGSWVSVPATAENIKPLDGFMVYNSNANNVIMTLNFKTSVTPAESILQKNLNYGWNLLGITTTESPFNNIGSAATMSIDFTHDGQTNRVNKIHSIYSWNSTSSNINNPEIGEAYGIFVNQSNVLYGGGGVATK